MSNSVVIKATASDIKKMAAYYHKNIRPKTPPYAEFSAKVGSTTITAYTSGKVMFQGANASTEASKWGTIPEKKEKKTTNQSSSLPAGFADWSVVGSDEVGNGSYFGPVVVCATYVDKKQIPLLKELGVRDSKELKDEQIRLIAEDIKLTIPYRELIVTPEKYNQIQPDYNVNRMKVALHNQAIYLLLEDLAPLKPEGILIDQFTPEANYRKHLAREKKQVTEKMYFTTKGEHYHLAVAAASIICRATFLNELDKATKELGLKVPSGAGANADLTAAKVLRKGGMPLLEQYAKLHFANTQKAQKKLN